MHDVLVLVVQLIGSIAVSAWIVRRDLGRLAPLERARAWPEASLWAAVVWFSPLCVLIHFSKTRRSFLGLGLGVLWLALALGAVTVLAWLADTAFEAFQ